MTKSRKNSIVGCCFLALTAIIWGSSFVAQSQGAQYVEPFTFICARSFLGSASLLPVIFIMDAFKKKKSPQAFQKMTRRDYKYLILSGITCGVALFFGSSLQQLGIDKGTAPGMAAFITAFYILLVPIFSIALGKKIRPITWLCALVSIFALYLLCVKEGGSVQKSDLYVLGCAFSFAIHIMIVDKVSPKLDGVRLSAVQFFVAGVIAAVLMVIFEDVNLSALKAAAPTIAYSGIMSSGVAYTLQILGQQKTDPTIASMIMSLESVFGVLTSMVVLSQFPSAREALGCVLMFGAIIVAQLGESRSEA